MIMYEIIYGHTYLPGLEVVTNKKSLFKIILIFHL